jgi:hypothetical protein
MNEELLQAGARFKTNIYNSVITVLKMEEIDNRLVVHIEIDNIEYTDKQVYEIGHVPINIQNLKFEILENYTKKYVDVEDNEGYLYWLGTEVKNRGFWNIDLKEVIDLTLDM